MRLLKILIGLPVLAYALVMGYLWYNVTDSAQKLVQAASPFATIKYDSVHVSPLGNELGLDNISIRPNMTNDEFRIEKVRMSAPHVGYFLQTGASLNKGAFPENLGIRIQRIHLDLNGEIFTMLDQMQQQAAAQQAATSPLMLEAIDGLGCGEKNSLTLSDYRRMGLGSIVADSDIEIGYNKKSNRANITARLNADNLYAIDITARFDVPTGTPGSMAASGTIPEMQLHYTDSGIYKLRNAYCASLNKSDIQSYVNLHIQLVGEQLGVGLPEKFLQAYRDYMLKGGTIEVNLNPASNIDPASFQYYPPDEVISMLGMQIAVNNERLDNTQIHWLGERAKPRKAEQPPQRGQTTSKQNNARPPRRSSVAQESTPRYRPAPTFHKVDIRNAERHINKVVEVTLYNGRVRKGILDNVNEGRLYLVLELHGGKLSYPVKMSDVEYFRVRY